MALPPLRFDPAIGRYRDGAGRFITERAVNEAFRDYVDNKALEAERLAPEFRSGRLSLESWRAEMRESMKSLHINAARLVKGGRTAMTPADNGRVGAILRREYTRLERWVEQIKAGWILDGRLVERSRQYINAAHDTKDTLEAEAWIARGASQLRDVVERNVLDPSGDHCHASAKRGTVGCVDLAALGWVPVGTLPPVKSHRRSCGRNCLCHVVREFADKVEATDDIAAIPRRSSKKSTPKIPFAPGPDSQFGDLLTFEGETSAEFQAEVRGAIAQLPAGVRERLIARGVKVRAGRTITEILPELATQQPRGYPPGWTWDTAEGLYHPQKKVIAVSEFARPAPGQPLERSTRIPGGIGHEAGHALDHAMRNTQGTEVSNQGDFLDAYAGDLENEDEWTEEERNLLKYFLQPWGAGRSETWAEGFAIGADLPATEAEVVAAFRRRFPQALAAILRLVG